MELNMLCKMIILQLNHQKQVIYLKIIHYHRVNIQGYENYVLDKMFKDNIKKVPVIWYGENNKKHRYYVDFFIKSLNNCIKITFANNCSHTLST